MRRIFIMSQPKIYSAKVNAAEGFDSPAPLADIPGWTVFKQQQTEMYIITHNLNLPDPERDLHVVATSMNSAARVAIEYVKSDSFKISAWVDNMAPVQTDFMFVAVCNNTGNKRPKAPDVSINSSS
jgi:hypothetical protein